MTNNKHTVLTTLIKGVTDINTLTNCFFNEDTPEAQLAKIKTITGNLLTQIESDHD